MPDDAAALGIISDTPDADDVHIDWHMTPAEWRELRAVITGVLDPASSPYIQRLKAAGALGTPVPAFPGTPGTWAGTADPLAAALAVIRERLDRAFTYEDWFRVGRDALSLLAAVDAVLKLADEWEREAARLDPSGADATDHAMPGHYLASGRAGALEDCTRELREAITSALAGKGGSDE